MRSVRLSFSSVASVAMLLVVACSSSSGAGGADATLDGARTNACLAYGPGYVCQSGTTCSAGFVNKQDYDCASSGELCCGPVGEAGVDANDDAVIFVDGATFDTSTRDATRLDAGGHDATTHDAGAHDAGEDTSKAHVDAGEDAGQHDAGHAHDAESDVGHVTEDGSTDAKHG